MAMQAEEIVSRITTLHPNATIDVSGEDCSFAVYVVSEEFTGKLTMQRQQPILALFSSELSSGKLHALSVTAKTPTELESMGGGGLVQIQVA
jgi:acid stress-induced BolA-like protein IbaG/YrbA